MSNNLKVTELDFNSIKDNLKNFLRRQTEFQDYDFEGSGLSVLLDILAYNTHYNAYYLNMVANESFLDTSILRDSAVSHAKTLGYTPHSVKASKAVVDLIVETFDASPGVLNLPRGFTFKSELMDNQTYNFVLIDDYSATKSGTTFYFENLPIYEGSLLDYSFKYSELDNPKSIFTIPEENIDTSSLKVIVYDEEGSSFAKVYDLATNIMNIDGESEIYFLQEGRNLKYEIYFGDGIVGKKLKNGSVVNISYLSTNGELANKLFNFRVGQSIYSNYNFLLTTVSESSGGSERESVEEIKYYAPLQYSSQNRLVTSKDFQTFIQKTYSNVDSLTVWGGEEENPPKYGKVYLSLKPKDGFFLSESEKERILKDIINPNSIITILPEIRDIEYLFLNLDCYVKYDSSKLITNSGVFRQIIKDSIISYKNIYLEKFNTYFSISKLQETINTLNSDSVKDVKINLRLQRKFQPALLKNNNYVIYFNNPLIKGTITNKLISNEFDVFDFLGTRRTVFLEEIPKIETGISEIKIVDPGSNYTTTPTVTIVGDGTGARAEAVVLNNRLQSINILNSGIDYTRATIVISGGGGYGASATAVLNTKTGTIRAVYYNELSERVVVNPNAGIIDYENGIIYINDIIILSVSSSDGLLSITAGSDSSLIGSVKNIILSIDEMNSDSIKINLEEI